MQQSICVEEDILFRDLLIGIGNLEMLKSIVSNCTTPLRYTIVAWGSRKKIFIWRAIVCYFLVYFVEEIKWKALFTTVRRKSGSPIGDQCNLTISTPSCFDHDH